MTFIPSRGFIAVSMAVTIAAILSSLVFAASTSVFLARANELDYEHQLQSRLFAASCLAAALSAYTSDHTYLPNQERVYVDHDHTCTIDNLNKVQSGDITQLVIKAHAIVNIAYSVLILSVPLGKNGSVTGSPVVTRL